MTFKRTLLISMGSFLAIALIAALLVNQYRNELYQMVMDGEAESSGLLTKKIQAGPITWSYMENGLQGKKPTLVLLHGFGSSKDTWLAMVKYLANDFHLVIPDLPGHGDSSFDFQQRYDFENQARLFGQFVDTLQLSRFHLIGNSMGGGISGLYAGTHADRLLSVILLDPAGMVKYPSEFQQYLERGENPILVESVDDLEFLFEFAVAEKITFPWPFNQVIVDRAIERRPMQNKVFADLTANLEYSIKEAVKQITAPTLVIWGKQDKLIAPANAALYSEANPAIQIKLLDQVGHIPMVEIPETCAELVRNFINETTASERDENPNREELAQLLF